MKAKSILKQNQLERDTELAQIMGVPLTAVEKFELCAPIGIRIFDGNAIPVSDEDMTKLYSDLKYLNPISYFKTLMWTSLYRRGSDLIRFLLSQKGKVCLDYGCGVGTHSIILKEQGNAVTMVDVEGPMLDFAIKRFLYRDWKFGTAGTTKDDLPSGYFDVVLCIEVLEHVFDPLKVLQKLHKAMKPGGQLFLRYSTMIKNSSGHFSSNIARIRRHCVPFLQKHFRMAGKDTYVKL